MQPTAYAGVCGCVSCKASLLIGRLLPGPASNQPMTHHACCCAVLAVLLWVVRALCALCHCTGPRYGDAILNRCRKPTYGNPVGCVHRHNRPHKAPYCPCMAMSTREHMEQPAGVLVQLLLPCYTQGLSSSCRISSHATLCCVWHIYMVFGCECLIAAF